MSSVEIQKEIGVLESITNSLTMQLIEAGGTPSEDFSDLEDVTVLESARKTIEKYLSESE